MSGADDTSRPDPTGPEPQGKGTGKALSPAARRALEEAKARREAREALRNTDLPPEENGPSGEEPTRYGDWERGGIAYDF